MVEISTEEIALRILKAEGAVEIRDVPEKVTNAEVNSLPVDNQPFLYASGNWGPGYISIKGLVGLGEMMPFLVKQLAIRITEKIPLDFVAGNLTGGVIPGWEISEQLSSIRGEQVQFLYVGGARKEKEEVEYPLTIINKDLLERMVAELCEAMVNRGVKVDFVAGMVAGGMIPGYRLSQLLSRRLHRIIPYVYIREKRKKGGQKELITGIKYINSGNTGIVVGEVEDFRQSTEKGMEILREGGFKTVNGAELLVDFDAEGLEKIKGVELSFDEKNPFIPLGSKGMVLEELVNFAQTTTNSARLLRKAGYTVDHAATILFYSNPEAIKSLQGDLKSKGLKMISLVTLPQLLDVAEKERTHALQAIVGYRQFLTGPLAWQAGRGLTRIEKGGTV